MPLERADRILALVPCAGRGARAGSERPKQYLPVAGRPLVRHTLAAFERVRRVVRVLVVVAPGDTMLTGVGARADIVDCGGASRAESVFNGLAHLRQSGASDRDWVLVHDAARCLITAERIDALIDACLTDAVGGLLALPLADTLKREVEGRAVATMDRQDKWLAQTPQMFRLGMLHAALAAHEASRFAGMTDEASAMEAAGYRPRLVRGSAWNIKVTYPEDFALAEVVFRSRDR